MLKAIGEYHGGLRRIGEEMGGRVYLARRRTQWTVLGNVLDAVKKIRSAIGHSPTVTEVKQLGYDTLLNAVNRYHGGWEAIRLALGEQKRLGRWNDLDDVLALFRGLREELGRFPRRSDLTQIRCSSILHAVQQRHGGMNRIYQLLNEKEKQKPPGYWSDFERIRRALTEIESVMGHFPSQLDLVSVGRSDLVTGIHRYHGGFRAVRDRLGREQATVPPGYWKDFAQVERAIRSLEQQVGHFPTYLEMQRIPGLKHAIRTYHGGYIKVRERMGAGIITRQDGYWRAFKHVKDALSQLHDEVGFFPTLEIIEQLGPRGLVGGIYLHHGGINAVRKKMGQPLVFPSALEFRAKLLLDRWVDDNDWVDGKRKDLRCHGLDLQNPKSGRPLQLDRYYFRAKVAIEIQGQQHYYPATRFGKEVGTKKSYEYRRYLDNVKKEQCLKQGVTLLEIRFDESDESILAKLRGHLKLRKRPLPLAELDGISKVADSIRYRSLAEIKAALSTIKDLAPDRYLTSTMIRQVSSPLYQAIKQYHGGIHAVRHLVGEAHPRRPKGYWTEKRVFDALSELYLEIGRWPRKREIITFDSALPFAIGRFGGAERFRNLIMRTAQAGDGL